MDAEGNDADANFPEEDREEVLLEKSKINKKLFLSLVVILWHQSLTRMFWSIQIAFLHVKCINVLGSFLPFLHTCVYICSQFF